VRSKATLVINKKETFDDGTIVQVVVWTLAIPLTGFDSRAFLFFA